MDSIINLVLTLSQDLPPTPKNIQKVASQTSEELAQWAFTQWTLRKKASTKFSRPQQMLFTREALEQASREEVVTYHASLFPENALVADLTTGIGGDLIGIAKRGKAIGYETDHERAAYAKHNLKVYGLDAEIREEDSLNAQWDFEYAFADPARRTYGKRTLDIQQFAPPLLALANKMKSLKLGVIKLTPMLQDSILNQLSQRVEFLSHEGECLEALALLGKETTTSPYQAIHVKTGQKLMSSLSPLPMGNPQEYLFEADPAAIRAHALGTLCEQLELKALGDSNGYLTSNVAPPSVWLKPYHILWSGTFHKKRLKETLRNLNGGSVIVKTRGVSLDPATLSKEFSGKGENPMILCIYKANSVIKVAICERYNISH